MTATAATRKVTEQLRQAREAEAREARERVEVVATRGRGSRTIVGRNMRQVAKELTAEGYRVDKAKAEGERLCIPHKDGYKTAVVRVRVKR